ncbi:MAG: hypothetical protein J5803_02145, partial [Desulfovibrio sp.]|nr:hypothetical protein [Desulfovibrio sp.]
KKIILLCIALFLALILFFLVKNRLMHPELTIETTPQSVHFQANNEVISKDMDEVAALMQMLKANPNDTSILLSLTDALMKLERWDAAEQFVRRALALEPENFTPNYLLGIILHQKNKPEEAALALEKALTIHDDAAARYSLGILYLYFIKDQNKGIDQLKKGLAIPDSNQELKAAITEELQKQTTKK